jgi:hypothetical protein
MDKQPDFLEEDEEVEEVVEAKKVDKADTKEEDNQATESEPEDRVHANSRQQKKSPAQETAESPSKRRKLNHVSGCNPIHSCPNECGYGLCHSCFVVKSISKEAEDHRTPRVRGKGQAKVECKTLHDMVNSLKELTEPAYFVASYVAKKGTEFRYPRKCAQCTQGFVIDK